ncbi:hypothetical protein DSUL_20101 [Desulfovibrionales bacterium]
MYPKASDLTCLVNVFTADRTGLAQHIVHKQLELRPNYRKF